jgi:two-component system invasion response regulator UvrY
LATPHPARLDLILLDLNMPGMSGAAAIGRFVAAFPQTPVVLMSGLASAADVTAVVRAAARGFLPKTMAPDHFVAVLSMIVDGGTYVPADILQIPRSEAPAAPGPLRYLSEAKAVSRVRSRMMNDIAAAAMT